MSAEIINLRKVRKAKQRREAATRAEENRAKFGRTKAEREATGAEKEREARRLDSIRRQGGDEESRK
jgi:Domain of unknown function (DUF4169)